MVSGALHEVAGWPLHSSQHLRGTRLPSNVSMILNTCECKTLRSMSVLSRSLASPALAFSCSNRSPCRPAATGSSIVLSLPLLISPYASRTSWRMPLGKGKSPASPSFCFGQKGGNVDKIAHVAYSRKENMQIETRAVGSSTDLYQDTVSTPPVADDTLLVVGPGVLGKLIAQKWFQELEGSKVIGQTKTTNNHEGLQSLGIIPALKEDQATAKYPYVVFCAPPYGNDDYIGEIRDAAQKWNGKGSLLFTSSSAVFDVNDNGPCDEGVAPIVAKGSSQRTDRLLCAEEEVLKVGGNVVRLAGLYTQDRGAHAYWWKLGTVDARPDHILNLIHYEDAASLCVAILKAKTSGQTFVGCDGTPVSRQEIVDLTAKSGKFEGEFKGFSATSGVLGKRMSNNVTREALAWQPKYGSFAEFVDTLS